MAKVAPVIDSNALYHETIVVKDPWHRLEVYNLKIVNGKALKHGKYSLLDAKGALITECWYVEGVVFGLVRQSKRENIVRSESEFVDGKLHGRSRVYFSHSDGLSEEIYWFQDARHGQYREWLFDGRLCVNGWYKHGQKAGIWTIYFQTTDDKLKKLVGGHVDGERDGLWVTWRPDGTKMNECPYKKGKPHGDFIEYDEKEKEIRRTRYVDGVKQD